MVARSSNKKKTGSESQFPGKLHNMMEFVEKQCLEDTISWVLNGHGFMINDPDKLVRILPLFFGQTKYRSFRRQLNMWHFERVADGPHKGAFMHPYFVRGNRELCGFMSRQIHTKTPNTNQDHVDKAKESIGSSLSSGGCSPANDSPTKDPNNNSLPDSLLMSSHRDEIIMASAHCRIDDSRFPLMTFDDLDDKNAPLNLDTISSWIRDQTTHSNTGSMGPNPDFQALDPSLEPNPFSDTAALDLHFDLNEDDDDLGLFGGRSFFVVDSKRTS